MKDEILKLKEQGLNSLEISNKLNISIKTVNAYFADFPRYRPENEKELGRPLEYFELDNYRNGKDKRYYEKNKLKCRKKALETYHNKRKLKGKWIGGNYILLKQQLPQ